MYELICRGLKYIVSLLEFEFSFELTKLRKECFIALRDKLGRIVKTEVPSVVLIQTV